MISRIDTAKERIAQIEASLDNIQEKIKRGKNNVEQLTWLDVGDLRYIAAILREMEEFCGS